MNKLFIPYEQSLDMKSIGFDEPCVAFYKDNWLSGCKYPDEDSQFDLCTNTQMKEYKNSDKYYSAPLYQQAFSFFREKYRLDSAVLENRYVIETKEDLPNWYYGFKTYEESELACLNKLIEIVKQKL
jgi:hypothetical protein